MVLKRKTPEASGPGCTDGGTGVPDSQHGGPANEYERQRAAIIARNRARLQELGLVGAFESFAQTVAPPKPKKVAAAKKPKVKQEPSRKSSRIAGSEAENEASELGLFVVNAECPRCGKVFTKGHKRHLEGCTAVKKQHEEDDGEEVEPDEEEEEEVARQPRKSSTAKGEAAKLKELELSGLVDFTTDSAEFVVLGSTGAHYKVVFTKDKEKRGFGAGNSRCECMDYRLRRHTCKHIKLILKQLGIDKEPDNWANAIEGQLDTLQTVTQDAPAEHQRHAKEPAKKKPAPKKKVNIEKGKAPDGGNPSLQMKGRKLPASLQ